MASYCCEAGGTQSMEKTTEWVSGEGRMSAVNKVWFCHNCGSIWLSETDEWLKTEPTRWTLWFAAKQRRRQSPTMPAIEERLAMNHR